MKGVFASSTNRNMVDHVFVSCTYFHPRSQAPAWERDFPKLRFANAILVVQWFDEGQAHRAILSRSGASRNVVPKQELGSRNLGTKRARRRNRCLSVAAAEPSRTSAPAACRGSGRWRRKRCRGGRRSRACG